MTEHDPAEFYRRRGAVMAELANTPQWMDAMGAMRLWARALRRDAVKDLEESELVGAEAERAKHMTVIAERLEKRMENIMREPTSYSAQAFASMIAAESLRT